MPAIVRKLLLIQGLITLVSALLAALLGADEAWRAALAGGGIVMAATMFSARRAFSAKPGSSPEQMLGALVRAEMLKFVFIGVAVLFSLRLMQTGHFVLFGTLLATLLANHIALLLIGPRTKTSNSS